MRLLTLLLLASLLAAVPACSTQSQSDQPKMLSDRPANDQHDFARLYTGDYARD